jgi:uracil-DNA glycosylase family 4
VSVLENLAREASGCTRCPLAAGRTQVVFGEGDPDAGLLVVGEAPGRDEDRLGRPFVGRSGQLLDRLLAEEAGLRREQVYIANVVKCRPPGNRDPRPDEIASCRPYLDRQVQLIRPRVVLTLGNFSTRLLLDTKLGITQLRGRTYPWVPSTGASGAGLEGDKEGDGDGASVVVPTFHPAAALRGGGEVLARMRADFVRVKEVLADIRPGRAATGSTS